MRVRFIHSRSNFMFDNIQRFKKWSIKISDTDKGRLSPPVIGSDGTIYVNSTSNKIYAINI